MENTAKTMNGLYESLGKLFYAVAMCDGSVHSNEWDKVKELVKEDWLYVDDFTDRYGTDAANQIEIVFDVLMETSKGSKECFGEFVEFYKEHPHAFSDEIKALTQKTAKAIANSFSGNNKSELILLAKIKLLLN
ncbi:MULTISPECIES: hypothetical protein [Maribacter]|uniref:Tellurite resistance protein TerB n=2 Tax=Maribacter dokdonensis TaxID=320912 RepID=A0A1H4R7G1_9FLAO|nr:MULTISPECIES: hypothetical protein [Maribacter]KSA11845.1 hypothetical protein I600_3640 [Maribacter dokdonensis DSW-8]MDF4223100.1 hypothetical protein [Maribacter huludaoensis]MDP2527279.1 hypothetical protein [Maribacter dokdonensis]CAG2535199.1 hypothetical protein MAR621_00027 [Maribacter dokdonensis]SDS62343.1 hypothetical protein SAMN05192545_1735 [Maribacter dokdonensis]